jgi:aspartate/methionine/tyrosine aminotransferase
MHAIAARHDLTMAGVSHPCQMALTEALSLPESFYARTMQGYAERKALLERALVEFGLKPWDAAGSYFLWCDYSELTDAVSDVFVQELMRQAGVTGVPGAIFYPQAYRHSRRIRFTFSKSLSTIRAAAAKLAASRQMVLAY